MERLLSLVKILEFKSEFVHSQAMQCTFTALIIDYI